MMTVDQMMLVIARQLGFEPNRAEIQAARRIELSNVPPGPLAEITAVLNLHVPDLPAQTRLRLSRDLNIMMLSAINYRVQMPIRDSWIAPGGTRYYICPRCHIPLDREYQAYCDRCGQHLGWKRIGAVRVRE